MLLSLAIQESLVCGLWCACYARFWKLFSIPVQCACVCVCVLPVNFESKDEFGLHSFRLGRLSLKYVGEIFSHVSLSFVFETDICWKLQWNYWLCGLHNFSTAARPWHCSWHWPYSSCLHHPFGCLPVVQKETPCKLQESSTKPSRSGKQAWKSIWQFL